MTKEVKDKCIDCGKMFVVKNAIFGTVCNTCANKPNTMVGV